MRLPKGYDVAPESQQSGTYVDRRRLCRHCRRRRPPRRRRVVAVVVVFVVILFEIR